MAKSKTAKELKPMKDRFLRNEKPENLYLTYALYFVMIFMSCLLIFVFLVGMCYVDGESMNPTLENGGYVLVLKNPSSVKDGDIITFRAMVRNKNTGLLEEESLIKRVMAVHGDELLLVEREGTPYVDLYRFKNDRWERLEESYLEGCEPMKKDTVTSGGKYSKNIVKLSASDEEKHSKSIKPDEGYVFVLGDNRNDSYDSCDLGLISLGSVRGKMIYQLQKGSVLQRLLLLIYYDARN